MANKHASLTALFTDIANAIREKTGDTASIIADDFPSVIRESLQKTVTLISFTISGISYQAEEGMTWRDWAGSSYDTLGCFVDSTGYVLFHNGGYVVSNNDYTYVVSTDVIIDGGDYRRQKYE